MNMDDLLAIGVLRGHAQLILRNLKQLQESHVCMFCSKTKNFKKRSTKF